VAREQAEAIAAGPPILSYIRETAAEYGVAEKIRCGHRVLAPAWSSAEARWTVSAERTFGLHPAVPGRVPRQGSRKPWKLGQTYAHDILALRCERSKTA